MNKLGPIGVFDSGYGGLTVLQEIRKALPEYDYIYLGDNARAPYGNRSFEVVHEFTLEAVNYYHDHLIDINSGEIVEFVDKDIEKLQNEVAKKLGYKLVDHKLELYGSKIKK